MKRHFTFLLFLSICMSLFAQNEGLSYQAVIINPDAKQLPGVDAKNNILPDTEIAIRFTIINALNQDEFQEIQYTRTDRFGMVNLLIGSENTDDFSLINWDGTIKDLKVEFDFEGSGGNFVDISRQQLTFIPYAYHRNITAHGTLTVDETTDLNGVLQVHGMTHLNSSLDVGGQTTLNDILTTYKNIYTNDSLFVDSVATFRGSAIFEEPVELEKLTVSGQAIIKPQLENMGKDEDYDSYPLRIEGSYQGIAIQLDSSCIEQNYLSFWDKSGVQHGRIEGQTIGELKDDREYKLEQGIRIADVVINSTEMFFQSIELIVQIVKLGSTIRDAATDAGDFRITATLVGPGVTSPSPGKIVHSSVSVGEEIANLILITANTVTQGANVVMAKGELDVFENLKEENIGVSYQSGAGDYAEWLPKENINEQFIAGELVGVRTGVVSKRIFGADRVMVVSTNPIVLGNMPQQQDESKHEKIAFLGQVPVRVIGEVQAGDYILPHELVLGFAKAVRPEKMDTRDYKKVVGVAWNTINKTGNDISVVNVAVGINTNDLADVVAEQKEELTALRAEYNGLMKQVEQSNLALAKLVPGYTDYVTVSALTDLGGTKTTTQFKSSAMGQDPCLTYPDSIKEVTIELSRKQVEIGFEIAKLDYQNMLDDANTLKKLMPPIPESGKTGLKSSTKELAYPAPASMDEHPFWSRINSDPAYKEEITQYIKTNLEEATKKLNLDNDSIKYNFEFTGF